MRGNARECTRVRTFTRGSPTRLSRFLAARALCLFLLSDAMLREADRIADARRGLIAIYGITDCIDKCTCGL